MKLTTKTIKAGTKKINATVTREQLDDLINFDRFYVEKIKLDKIINNDLISFDEMNEKCLYIHINYKLLKRVEKLVKITDDEKVKEVVVYVRYVDSIKKSHNMAYEMEKMLADELSKSINNEIIKNVMSLKK